MLAMVLEMSLTALSGAPVGTTGIGNMSVSVMSGQGGGRGAGASRIISSNCAIAEPNGGQVKPVTATALSCEVSGGGHGNGSLTVGSEGVGGTMGAAGKIGRVVGNHSRIGGAIGALVGATVASGRA